jgi:2-keto-4-pentenoate hydratase
MEDWHRHVCETIWSLWQEGEVIDCLPADLRPSSRAEGYAIQAGLEAFSSTPRYGWKIAATSLAGQQHIGVDQPLAGRLLAERIIEDGCVASISSNRMRVAEPEFAFRLARDLAPRNTPYEVSEVMAAVGDLHLCLELPDSRFRDFAAVGTPSLIADNACARDLVVGRQVAADWRAIDLASHKVHAVVRSRYERDGIGSNVLGDPRIALTWLVNEVTSLGIVLKPGELITTGACVVPMEIEPGEQVTADFGILGSVSIEIAAQI